MQLTQSRKHPGVKLPYKEANQQEPTRTGSYNLGGRIFERSWRDFIEAHCW